MGKIEYRCCSIDNSPLVNKKRGGGGLAFPQKDAEFPSLKNQLGSIFPVAKIVPE
jgi:hypothetical protein